MSRVNSTLTLHRLLRDSQEVFPYETAHSLLSQEQKHEFNLVNEKFAELKQQTKAAQEISENSIRSFTQVFA